MALPSFTGVYVFGDSLVDAGNALKAAQTLDKLPFTSLPNGAPTADKGYFEGRFTDGYNFVDLISNKMVGLATRTTFPYGFEDPVFGIDTPFASRPQGVNLNFAYGGAQANQGSELVPDLDDQTDAYRNYPSADPNALYIVTIGGNDVRDLVTRSSAPVVGAAAQSKLQAAATEIAQEVGQLFAFGARHILVTGIPDIGLLPYYLGAADEAALRSLATQYSETLDALLTTALGGLVLPAGAELYRYSFNAAGDAFFADPQRYALSNLTQARTTAQAGALQPVGSGYLFFDQVHPSAQVHAIVAADILASLAGAGGQEAATPDQPGPKILAAVSAQGEVDEFTVSLTAGRSYLFDLLGISSGSGSLADPKLRLLDASGAVVAENDDGGLGLNSHLPFVAALSGDYRLQVSGVGVTTGGYVLEGPGLRGSNVTVVGGALDDAIGAIGGANHLSGGAGADTITGGAGPDDIHGDAGDDQLAGGSGDDLIDGGTGSDTAKLAGPRSSFSVHTTAGGGGVTTRAAGEGADQITNVETLGFDGVAFPLRGIQQNHLAAMDSDRFDDVLLQSVSTGQLIYADMDGTVAGAGFKTILGTLPAGWKVVGSGDFTGDGRAEALIQNTADGALYIYGAGGWGTISKSLTADWQVKGVGDFTGDGTLDVLVRNAVNGQVVYAELDGSTFTGWALGANVGTGWATVAIGDFDRDGYSDQLVQDLSTGVTLYANIDNGSPSGWGLVSGALPPQWVAKEAVDLNGDGYFDVVFQNTATGQVFYVNMAGGSNHGWGVVATASGWTVVGSGDYDNDGWGDVLLRNPASGQVAYANMDAGAFAGWGFVSGALGTDWIAV